jgi:hypothetical protein
MVVLGTDDAFGAETYFILKVVWRKEKSLINSYSRGKK